MAHHLVPSANPDRPVRASQDGSFERVFTASDPDPGIVNRDQVLHIVGSLSSPCQPLNAETEEIPGFSHG
jgi:hypothetical protein